MKIKENSAVAIILARKNSERLKNKHLILIDGKPLIQFTFDYALRSPSLNDIICSTDSADIARLARLSGIQVIRRPPRLATCHSHIIDAVRYTLRQYYIRKKFLPEITVILYGNVPYREIPIEEGIHFVYKKKADVVFTARKVSKYHPYWMFKKNRNNKMIFDRETKIYRQQDLPDYYLSTDSFIISKTTRLFKKPDSAHLYSEFSDEPSFIEERRSAPLLDIDTEEDLFLFKNFLAEKGKKTEISYWKAKQCRSSRHPKGGGISTEIPRTLCSE